MAKNVNCKLVAMGDIVAIDSNHWFGAPDVRGELSNWYPATGIASGLNPGIAPVWYEQAGDCRSVGIDTAGCQTCN